MTARIDLSGQRFGSLVAVAHAGRDATGKTLWECACDCGSKRVVTGMNLKTGNTKSCGCRRYPRGTDNPRTITDRSRIAERKRTLAAHRSWRLGVINRNPKCLKCGRDSNLHAHHLVGYADSPDLRVSPENGATLCGNCHMRFHLMYGRKTGFTEANFCEFVGGVGESPPSFDMPVLLDEDSMNVIKYVTRWKDKGGIADLEKAKHYIDLLIELTQREGK